MPGPRVGALLAPEELGLDQRGRQSGAVDLDHGPLPQIAQGVDGVRQHLLAGAGLAEEQDGGLGRGDLGDLLQHPVEARGAARQGLSGPRARGLAQVGILRLQALLQPRDLGPVRGPGLKDNAIKLALTH